MTGNRDRNKREKSARIFAAADELFGAHGYAAVSTQQIADHAQVAAGTIFRYAATKGELLLMVMNEGFRASIAEGRDRARSEPDAAAAILAMLVPILDLSARAPENSHVYQRELMFGTAGETFRDEGLALIAELEAAIAARLTVGVAAGPRAAAATEPAAPEPAAPEPAATEPAATEPAAPEPAATDAEPAATEPAAPEPAAPEPAATDAELAADAVFALLHLAVTRFASGVHDRERTVSGLRTQIAQIVAGTIAAAPEVSQENTPTGKVKS